MVLGPGGSGVSAISTSAALQRSTRRGSSSAADPRSRQSISEPERDTLLITVDRLTEVADVLGVYRRPGEPVAVSAHLHLLILDRLDLLEQSWTEFTDLLEHTRMNAKTMLPGVDAVAGIDAGELSTLPGIEEFLLLKRIRDEATSGLWRRIVVDCSGVGDPFAFLRCASTLSQMVNRLWPRHRRLAAAAEKPVMAQLTSAIEAIDRDCLDVAELVADPQATAIHVVVDADRRGERLLAQMLATTDLMGLPLASVWLNRDPGDADPGDTGRGGGVTQSIGTGVQVRRITRAIDPLDRAARLRKLRITLPAAGGTPQGSAAAQVSTLCGSGTSTIFELSWPQRLPDPDTLRLGRSGDDLVVTVSGFRYPVRLPSVLRRCLVVDASWNGTELTVRFQPDPAVWPRG